MSKKYSVNIEDDQVVSVEVDGVEYPSPEEIPNARDREKIHQLITKLSAVETEDDPDQEFADFDKEFADFEQEFNEMEPQPSKMPLLMMAIFGGIALLMLAIAIFSSVQVLGQTAKEQAAPGRVVDLTVRSSFDSATNETNQYSYPKVEFTVPGGATRTVQLSEGEWPPSYEVGDAVTILYDPDQPRKARIQSFSSTLLLWILPGITGTVGIAFLFAAFIVFKLKN